MKYVGPILIAVFLMAGQSAQAETVFMKDGRIIRGEIVEQNSYRIKLKHDGRVRGYYMEEIDRIEKIADTEITENIDFDQFEFTRESKVEYILKLMEANGTRAVLEQNLAEILETAPDGRKEEMRSIFDIDGLMQELIPVFDEHYTEADIIELINFYESPIGQKVIEVSPVITKQVMETTVNYFLKRSKM